MIALFVALYCVSVALTLTFEILAAKLDGRGDVPIIACFIYPWGWCLVLLALTAGFIRGLRSKL